MKLARVQVAQKAHWAVVEGELLRPLALPPWEGLQFLGGSIPLREAQLLPPAEPAKIVCVGLNYKAHAEEMGKALPTEPLLFLKSPQALLAPGEAVVLPPDSQQVEHEGELALVIGKKAKHVPVEEALHYVLGFTCLDDVTARDIQRREKVYARAKGYDTFCPLGPWLETDIANPQDLQLSLRVNGLLRQEGSTADMIFSVAQLIAFASRIMTLLPGDVLTTGTPPGVGPLKAGDLVEVSIPPIGTLRHSVVAA
jgi:2-keto-4-pentenoate hydratase/2-oxohepta-3-ene-1,7-dioic acid hydratase in catechol pathway